VDQAPLAVDQPGRVLSGQDFGLARRQAHQDLALEGAQDQQAATAGASTQLPTTGLTGEWLALPPAQSEEQILKQKVETQLDLMATYNYLIQLSSEGQ